MASTIRDVAARAGLSVGTVSKYINGKTVKESTRLAIEEAIKELDFHPKNKYLYLSLNGKNNYVKQSSRLRPLNLSPSQIRTCGFPAYGSS